MSDPILGDRSTVALSDRYRTPFALPGDRLADSTELVRPYQYVQGVAYYCPSCKTEVGVRPSINENLYFYHLHKANSCNSENVIHHLAEVQMMKLLKAVNDGRLTLFFSEPRTVKKHRGRFAVMPGPPPQIEFIDEQRNLRYDVAEVIGDDPVLVIEIRNTHAVGESKRERIHCTWFEFEADAIMSRSILQLTDRLGRGERIGEEVTIQTVGPLICDPFGQDLPDDPGKWYDLRIFDKKAKLLIDLLPSVQQIRLQGDFCPRHSNVRFEWSIQRLFWDTITQVDPVSNGAHLLLRKGSVDVLAILLVGDDAYINGAPGRRMTEQFRNHLAVIPGRLHRQLGTGIAVLVNTHSLGGDGRCVECLAESAAMREAQRAVDREHQRLADQADEEQRRDASRREFVSAMSVLEKDVEAGRLVPLLDPVPSLRDRIERGSFPGLTEATLGPVVQRRLIELTKKVVMRKEFIRDLEATSTARLRPILEQMQQSEDDQTISTAANVGIELFTARESDADDIRYMRRGLVAQVISNAASRKKVIADPQWLLKRAQRIANEGLASAVGCSVVNGVIHRFHAALVQIPNLSDEENQWVKQQFEQSVKIRLSTGCTKSLDAVCAAWEKSLIKINNVKECCDAYVAFRGEVEACRILWGSFLPDAAADRVREQSRYLWDRIRSVMADKVDLYPGLSATAVKDGVRNVIKTITEDIDLLTRSVSSGILPPPPARRHETLLDEIRRLVAPLPTAMWSSHFAGKIWGAWKPTCHALREMCTKSAKISRAERDVADSFRSLLTSQDIKEEWIPHPIREVLICYHDESGGQNRKYRVYQATTPPGLTEDIGWLESMNGTQRSLFDPI